MYRRIALAAAMLTAAAALVVPASAGSHHILVGIFDDAQVLGNSTRTFPLLKTLRVQIIRVSLPWGSASGVARRRPKNPRDPADPAYNWTRFDRALLDANKEKIRVLFNIVGTPRWANGNRSVNRAPNSSKNYGYLRDFAYAAATRYSGEYKRRDRKVLPAVRYWLAWNEPNNPVFLYPQYRKVGGHWVIQSARDYAKICSAIYSGVHGTRLTGEQVACGATSPRGNDQPRSSRPAVDPLTFLSALRKAGLSKFDAYAHHPYYGDKRQTPTSKPEAGSVRMGNLGTLIKLLTHLYGNKHLWITEYGYQTMPPDRIFGVSWKKQARYLAQAFAIARRNPRIDMMIWFLVRDEARLSGWQSGFQTAGGRKKPSFSTFQHLPH